MSQIKQPVPVIADAVAAALGGAPSAALHVPTFAGNEWGYVKECIDTGWVSSAGEFVNRFERAVAEYTGAPYAIATVNGTAALHMALMLAGVGRPVGALGGGDASPDAQDEVLMPALTFVATANAVAYTGAVPHFVDVDPTTFGVHPQALAAYAQHAFERRGGRLVNRKTGRRVSALIVMHAFGHPADLAGLQGLCREWDIPLIEDAAESLGSFYQGRHTGTFGRLGVLSFNGNKIITTGGGGMILTADPELAAAAKHLTTTAKLPHAWEYVHDRVGYNYRLPNINAALGVAQMERLPQLLAAKRKLFERYRAAFEGIQGVTILREPPDGQSNYWLNALVLDEALADQRDPLLKALSDAGFQVRPIWQPMHLLPMYRDCPRMDLPVTESLARRVINLPSSAHL